MKNKIKMCLLGLVIILAFILVYKNNNLNLEILKNTNLADDEKIERILKSIDYGKNIKNYEIKDNDLNISYDIEDYEYKNLEKNASILFYLINDLKEINYTVNNENYSFDYSKISLIYKDSKNFNLETIKERYNSKKFDNLYLGNINGNIDLFDKSDLCITDYIEIYRDNEYVYYMTCSSVDDIIAVIDNKEYKLIEALNQEKIDINDLFDINVQMKKESINNDENIN